MKYKSLAVKIGSNVLSRPDGTLDITRMSALVDQVADLRRRGIDIVMISSGAVAAGRSELRQDGSRPDPGSTQKSRLSPQQDGSRPDPGSTQKSLDAVSQRQLFSAVGQAKLINRYYELFRDHGLSCGQVLTTKENFSTRRHYLNQKHCMEVMLAAGVIPVVNENDTVSLTELMFTDNDELSGLIATMMGMDALVILSNIDGVYDGDPSDPASRLITDVAPADDPTRYVQAGKSTLGRGGMGTKMRIARKVASEGLDVIIANGKRPNILVDLITRADNTPCTVFHAASAEPSSVKKWIAHSEGFAKGEVHVNQGAADALLSGSGASLLAVGITRIEGEWEKDDVIKVIAPDGRQIALGRAGYSSATAAKVIGRTGQRPLIHADYLYLEGAL